MNDLKMSEFLFPAELCKICLSLNRKLTPIKPFMVYLLKPYGLDFNMEDALCWECSAILLKFSKFKQKALYANQLLNNFYKFQTKFSSLSALTTTICENIYEMEHKGPIMEQNIPEHKVQEQMELSIKLETEYFDYNKDNDFDYNKDNDFDYNKDNDFDYDDILKDEIAQTVSTKSEDLSLELNELKEENNQNKKSIVVKQKKNLKRAKSKKKTSLEFEEINQIEESIVKRKQKAKRRNLNLESAKSKKDSKFKFKIENEVVSKIELTSGKGKDNLDGTVKYNLKKLTKEEMIELRNMSLNNLIKGIMFMCVKCVVGFKTEFKLNEHTNLMHNKNNENEEQCSICECYVQEKKMEKHVRMHHVAYECVVCKHLSRNRILAGRHYDWQHSNKAPAKCNMCKRTFMDQESLLKHRQKAHRPVDCDICGLQLKHKRSLQQHMLAHTGQHLYECPICKKQYKGRTGLRIHMSGVHQSSRPENAYCAECDIHYKSIHTYKLHLRESTKHTKVNQRYHCDLCGKSFISKQYIKTHIRLIHSKISKYICHLCNKKFPGPKKLQDHIDFVHNKLPKPKIFECNVCNKKFSLKHVLKSHLNYHTGERPHKCVLCDATFSQNGALYKHRQLVHKIKKLSE